MSNPNLLSIIQKLNGGPAARDIAVAHNFRFDGHPDPVRSGLYERDHAPASPDFKAWEAAHRAYLETRVQVPVLDEPETFGPVNDPAIIAPDGERWLLRIEDLRYALYQKSYGIDALVSAMNEGERNRPEFRETVRALNTRPFGGGRPRFACFEDEVHDDAAATDWQHRLRDRLGLSHYNPDEPWSATGKSGPIPVALMRYQLKDVLAGLTDDEKSRAVAVPSVLDSEFNPYFFPSPLDLGFGRTMNLNHFARPDEAKAKLVSEILHRRLDYRTEHVHKIAWITAPLPKCLLRDLRDQHHLCVSLEAMDAGLDGEFGEEMPSHAVG